MRDDRSTPAQRVTASSFVERALEVAGAFAVVALFVVVIVALVGQLT